MTDHLEVRSGAYYDSVSLMQVSRQVASAAGVVAAQVAMATELNLEVIGGMGFSVPGGVQPNELVVAVRAEHEDGPQQEPEHPGRLPGSAAPGPAVVRPGRAG